MEDYVKKVTGIAQAEPDKVILVGHSMAGAIISQSAEVLGPQKVAKLIYLDAFLLTNGQSIMAQVDQMFAHHQASQTTGKYRAVEGLLNSEDGRSVLINPLLVEEVYCHDCPEADKARLKRNGKWQAIACLTTPISVTDSRYGRIPKYYIRCTQSRDLDRSFIVDNVPCEKVYTLPSSHSPVCYGLQLTVIKTSRPIKRPI